tara:strand:+ start:44 stop:517 length:474 start_codon:yes stop_codon:yes gene_type:complete
MNITYDIEKYNKKNIFFLETKQNMLMDGKFTKLLFSDNIFTTIGIFLNIQFNSSTIYQINKKCILKFEKNDMNMKTINNLANIERTILQYYKNLNNCNKEANYLLYNTLMNGSIKLYVKQYSNLSNLKYIIKISGVWENDKEVGITYKFLEISDLQH